MVARSDLTPLGLRLAWLLVEGAAVVTAPSFGGAIALGKGVYEWWQDIAALGKRGSEATDALGKGIASRLEAAVRDAKRRHKEQDANIDSLPGAVTAVETLLEQVASDGGVVVAAVRDPDHFEDLLRQRGKEFRKNVEEKAEPLFDELVRTVAREFTSLAPGSSRFSFEALKQLLTNTEETLKVARRIEARQIESQRDITEIKADVKDIAKVVNTPHASAPARPSRIRFGSRPMEALGFVTRSEQEDLFDAVFSAAAPRTILAGMPAAGSHSSLLPSRPAALRRSGRWSRGSTPSRAEAFSRAFPSSGNAWAWGKRATARLKPSRSAALRRWRKLRRRTVSSSSTTSSAQTT